MRGRLYRQVDASCEHLKARCSHEDFSSMYAEVVTQILSKHKRKANNQKGVKIINRVDFVSTPLVQNNQYENAALIYSHEVRGDPVGAAGDGFELHPLQVHVFGQTPLQHVSCHPHRRERILLSLFFFISDIVHMKWRSQAGFLGAHYDARATAGQTGPERSNEAEEVSQPVCFRSYSSATCIRGCCCCHDRRRQEAIGGLYRLVGSTYRSVRSDEKRKHLSLKGRRCSLVTLTAGIDSEKSWGEKKLFCVVISAH